MSVQQELAFWLRHTESQWTDDDGSIDFDELARVALGSTRDNALERLMEMSDEHAASCAIDPCPFKALDDTEGMEIVDAILGES